jgi:ribosomal protein S18 acetylase RimI-like enzyme
MSSTSVEAARPGALQVRQATDDDVDLIAPLFDDYRRFYDQRSDLEGARAFIRARLQRWESVILLALSTNATHAPALGFVQLYPSFSSVSMRRLWILNDLFVAEHVRRRGVARELLSATHRFARESRAVRIELTTAPSNHAAKRLYEAHGYRMVNEFLAYSIHP